MRQQKKPVPFWRRCMPMFLILGSILVLLNAALILHVTSSFSTTSQENQESSYIPSSDDSWVLNLRVQKTGSTTSEVFLQKWLQQHRGVECGLLRSCRTIHENDVESTRRWDKDTPACTCDAVEEIIQENIENAKTCRAINAPHMDYKDLTQWFHGDCTNRAKTTRAIIMTVLRNPVDRVLSEYTMLVQEARRIREPYFIKGWDYGCLAKSLQEYLSNTDCQLGSTNRQTRTIAGHGSNVRWQDVYKSPQEMLQTAKDNLRHNIQFGITEYWQESAQLLERVLSGNKSETVHRKKQKASWERINKNSPSSLRLSNTTRELAEQVNSLDQELYSFAVDLFWERYCSAFPNEEQCQ